mgnify:CR=1 FL=1
MTAEDLLYCCFSLGLCKHNDLVLVQGNCLPMRSEQFLNHLLDLVETQQSLVQHHGANNSISFDKDYLLVKHIAVNQEAVFSSECKLFANDVMSKMSNEAVYVFFFDTRSN